MGRASSFRPGFGLRTVRGHFIALVIAIMVPAAIMAGWILWLDAYRKGEALERDLLDRAKSLSQSIERELNAAISTLETLRHASFLQQGDIPRFFELAKRVQATNPHWLGMILTDKDGQQLMNTAAQAGQPLPNIGHYEVIKGALAGRPSISEVMVGRVRNVHLIGIDIPVTVGGEIKYALGLSMPAAHFQQLLTAHPVPPGWITGIVDSKGTIIARSVDPERGIGTPTAKMWMEANEPTGVVRGVGRLNLPVFGAYHRSDLSGWKSIISVPAEILTQERNRGLGLIALSGGLLLGIGLLAAGVLGARVLRPIEHLVKSADAYVAGDAPKQRLTNALVETEELADALTRAGAAQRQALSAKESTDIQFQRLVHGVSDHALYMLDADGHVISWNKGAQRIKGYEDEQVIGKHFSIFYTEEDRVNGLPDRAIRTAAQEGHYEAEGWRVRKDGTRFWANAVIDRIQDPSGQTVGYAKITRDITQRRDAEEKLRAAREQLFQSQKMEAVGHLTGGVAHDFNNLLTIIIGNLDAARRTIGDWKEGAQQRLSRQINSALQGAQRAATLTSQLLAFSRRQPLEPRPLDLNKFLRTISGFLRPSLGETVELEVVGSGGLWPVEVDQNQLETSLLNLVVNARDAMPEGGKLTIEASNVFLDEEYAARHPDVRSGQYVAISVTDNGVGIPKDMLEKVYEPFFTTKGPGKGTGLGLSQVYGFVKQSGGHIKIYSEVGEGTTVRIYLLRTHGSVTSATTGRKTADQARGNEVILLVEDDNDVREFVEGTLQELGYRIVAVRDATAALTILDQQQADLLLTDVVLPGLNGRELADAARERNPTLKVLFMTGYSRNAIVHQGRLDPGVDLLQKPLTQTSLAAGVRAVLDRQGD